MRSLWSVIASIAVVAALFAFVPVAPAQAAGSNLTLSKSGDATALIDAPISYTLTAHNGSTGTTYNLYNLSFRDVLPVGVSYRAGSTSRPKGMGDPQIITIGTAPATQQVLIWSNVSDLPIGADQTVAFQVDADPTTYPVGSTVRNTGYVYGQTDPRTIPKFDGSGNPQSGSYTDAATSAEFDTRITAITIAKSENSPEHELMRGVHDDTAVYTLKVTNNDYKATDGNTVIDYLPAGLEFLGCGGVDNGTTQEYGARTLAGTPAPGGTCVTPASVDTIALAAGNAQGLAAGVYTQVTWTVGDLAASGTWTTQYRAGIPQHANTMTFTGTKPSAASGQQGANLDNNTGADTREQSSGAGTQDGELGLTNLARVTGSYTGTVAAAGDQNVLDSDSVTVTA
jgi:large repetitive protein